MRRAALILAVGAALAAGGAQAGPKCARPGAAKDVEAAVRGWFAAFAREDYAAGYALQAPGFYAYDGGKRFNGTELGELLRTAKAAGSRVEWNLHDLDVHVACDQQPVTWLESMVLGYADGRWRVEFLHSDRVRTN